MKPPIEHIVIRQLVEKHIDGLRTSAEDLRRSVRKRFFEKTHGVPGQPPFGTPLDMFEFDPREAEDAARWLEDAATDLQRKLTAVSSVMVWFQFAQITVPPKRCQSSNASDWLRA
jgi:hypothetical protein